MDTQSLHSLEELIFFIDKNWNDLKIEAVGSWSGKGWDSEAGRMKIFEIALITGGNSLLRIDRTPYEVKRGHLYFADLHLSISCSESDIRMHFIDFSAKKENTCMELRRIFKGLSGCFRTTAVEELRRHFEELEREFSGEKAFGDRLSKHEIFSILAKLYRSLSGQSDAHYPDTVNPVHTRMVNEIIRLMNEEFSQPFELKDLAERYNLTVRYLNTLFKNHTGNTLMNYYMKLRLEKAKRMLSFTSLNITQVALEAGFCDCQHFCRVFKQHTGSTPMEFRNGQYGLGSGQKLGE